MMTNKQLISKRAEEKRKDCPKRKAYMKELHKQPHIVKKASITRWKKKGILCDDYDALYDDYLSKTNCEKCDVEFNVDIRPCLDHDHDTGIFRAVLCHGCNLNAYPEERAKRSEKRRRSPEHKMETRRKYLEKITTEIFNCECGASVKRINKMRHLKTIKHKNFIGQN